MQKYKRLYTVLKKRMFLFVLGTIGVSARNFGIILLNAYFASTIVSSITDNQHVITIHEWMIPSMAIILFCLMDAVFMIIHGTITHNMISDLRSDMFRKIIRAELLPLGPIGEKGQLISRFNNDLDLIQRLLKFQILTPTMAVFSGISSTVSLLLIPGARITIFYAYCIGLICFYTQVQIGRQIKTKQMKLQTMKAKIGEWVALLWEKGKELRLQGEEDNVYRYMEDCNKKAKTIEEAIGRLGLINQIVEQMPKICQYFLGIIISLYLYGKGYVSLSQVVLIAPMMGMIVSMMVTTGSSVISIYQSSSGVKRAAEILNLPQEDELDSQMTVSKQAPVFDIAGLVFNYDRDHTLIDDLTICFDAGTIVGISGESGTGKSTLIKILMGLYPYAGSIKYYQREMSIVSKHALRNNIAYCSQDDYLISGTIRENLLLGLNEKKEDGEINDLLRVIGADEWIKNRGGLDQRIEDNNLSGGQSRMIVLTRALLSGKGILVLDETLSGMDKKHQEKALAALSTYKQQGKLIFLISHNTDILKSCDMIFDIKNNGECNTFLDTCVTLR